MNLVSYISLTSLVCRHTIAHSHSFRGRSLFHVVEMSAAAAAAWESRANGERSRDYNENESILIAKWVNAPVPSITIRHVYIGPTCTQICGRLVPHLQHRLRPDRRDAMRCIVCVHAIQQNSLQPRAIYNASSTARRCVTAVALIGLNSPN